jgi:hypothetical protein
VAALGDELRIAYEWYLGRNRNGVMVADLATGGCRDGIDGPRRVNDCMGAESTLAFQQAAWTMRELT